MSNHAVLQATKFVAHPQGTETLGYRLYDDYAQSYDNNMESLPDDDLEFLKLVLGLDHSDVVTEIFAFIEEEHTGLDINGNWYDWDDIKHLFSPGQQ